MFAEGEQAEHRPVLIGDDFDSLLDAVEHNLAAVDAATDREAQPQRPPRLPRRQPQPPRNETDWHPAVAKCCAPTTILFDWHATLVDTLDAMYYAVDDLLPVSKQMGLLD